MKRGCRKSKERNELGEIFIKVSGFQCAMRVSVFQGFRVSELMGWLDERPHTPEGLNDDEHFNNFIFRFQSSKLVLGIRVLEFGSWDLGLGT